MLSKDSLQVENGNFTRIINPVIDSLVKIPFKGCELSVALFIIRKTWGFQKKEDEISLSQIEKGVCRSKPSIIKALKNLQLVKVLILVKKGESRSQSSVWRLNKYIDEWLVSVCDLTGKGVLTGKGGFTTTGKGVFTTTGKGGFTHKRKIKENIKKYTETIVSDKKLKANKTIMRKNTFGRYNENLSADSFEDVVDMDSGEVVKERKPQVKEAYEKMLKWAEERRGFKFINKVKQYTAFKKARGNKIKASDLRQRWKEFEQDDFYKKNGFDWQTVVNSFDRRKK